MGSPDVSIISKSSTRRRLPVFKPVSARVAKGSSAAAPIRERRSSVNPLLHICAVARHAPKAMLRRGLSRDRGAAPPTRILENGPDAPDAQLHAPQDSRERKAAS